MGSLQIGPPDTFTLKYQKLILNPSVWHLEAKNDLLGTLRVKKIWCLVLLKLLHFTNLIGNIDPTNSQTLEFNNIFSWLQYYTSIKFFAHAVWFEYCSKYISVSCKLLWSVQTGKINPVTRNSHNFLLGFASKDFSRWSSSCWSAKSRQKLCKRWEIIEGFASLRSPSLLQLSNCKTCQSRNYSNITTTFDVLELRLNNCKCSLAVLLINQNCV